MVTWGFTMNGEEHRLRLLREVTVGALPGCWLQAHGKCLHEIHLRWVVQCHIHMR
jgi:hypothetical protein